MYEIERITKEDYQNDNHYRRNGFINEEMDNIELIYAKNSTKIISTR